ncbi:sensor histidine kinase [Hydrogenobaculum sp.]
MATDLFRNIFINARLKFALLNSFIFIFLMGFFYYITYNLYVGYAEEIIKNRSEELAKVALLKAVEHRHFSLPPGFSILIKSQNKVYYSADNLDKDDKRAIRLKDRFEYNGKIYTVFLKASVEDIIESEKRFIFYASVLFFVLVLFVFGLSYLFAGIFLKPIEDYTQKLDIVLKGSMHAINTPLSILKLSDIKDKKAKDAISRIEDTIGRVKSIFISKPSQETLLSINAFVEDVLDALEDSLESKNITVNLEENTTLKVYGDPVDISMIIENIFDNALKYNKENGFINVKISASKLIVENPSEPISDTSRIFELFYREDESKEGLGLGLYIVKTLCERNGIFVKAKYENGIFRIVLEW